MVVTALGRWLRFCVTELFTMLEFCTPCDWESWCCMSSVVCASIHQCHRLQKLPLQCFSFGTCSYLCKCCGGVVETRSSRSHGVLQQPECAESRKGKKGDYYIMWTRCVYEECKGFLVSKYSVAVLTTGRFKAQSKSLILTASQWGR